MGSCQECIEAIESNDPQQIKEELGDLLRLILFLLKIGDRDQLFSASQTIALADKKVISRHPHVFDSGFENKAQTEEEAQAIWNDQKALERKDKQDPLKDLETVPTLIKAQKLIKRMKKSGYEAKPFEDPIDEHIWKALQLAQKEGQVEEKIRNVIREKQTEFSNWLQKKEF